jgi:hypothetical protein
MPSRNTKVGARHVANTSSADNTEAIPQKQPKVHASTLPKQGSSFTPDPGRIAIPGTAARPNLGRHAAICRICAHPQREEIEADFVAWKGATQITREYRLTDRSCVYRHAYALNLFPKRRRNLRGALELIIEKAGQVEPNGNAVVAAVQLCAKINRRGELVEWDERLALQDLFDRMQAEEYEAYAKDGILPNWFREEIAAVGGRVPNGGGHA